MVELKIRKWEMRGDGANHDEKLGLQRNWWASQFTIPDTAGTSPNLAGNNADMMSSNLNEACHSPDFSYPLVFCILFSSSPPISLPCPLLYQHHKTTKLHHPSLSLHVMIMSLHQVLHTLSIASTQNCWSSLQFHNYKLTPECSFGVWCASLYNRPPSC
jgi:hypothetical protein